MRHHHRAKGFCRARSAVFRETETTAKSASRVVVARRRSAFGASRRRAKRVEHHRTHLQRFPERKREKVSTSSSSSSSSSGDENTTTTNKSIDETIVRLAVPALATLLLDPLLSASDTAFVGRQITTTPFPPPPPPVLVLDEDEEGNKIDIFENDENNNNNDNNNNTGLAALAVSSSVFNFVSYSGSFLAIATAPLVSREVAENEAANATKTSSGNKRDASKTVAAALVLAACVGVTAATVVEVLVEPLLSLSGGESLGEAAYKSAEDYVRVRALGLPFFCCSLIGIGAFRGVADTKSILNVALVAESVHFVLDWVLVLGLHLGVVGAGWSTFASTVLEFLLFSRALFERGIVDSERFFENIGESAKDIGGKLGQLVSNGSNQLLRTLFLQTVLVRATALATENDVSGPHQIVSQVWWIELFILDAIAVAAQTLVSTRLATNDGSDEDVLSAREAVDRCLLWAFALGVFLTVVTEIFVDEAPKIFTTDATVASATFVPLAFIVAPLQPLSALVFVGDGVFQGANDFKFLAKAMLFCSLLSVGAFQTPAFADAFDAALSQFLQHVFGENTTTTTTTTHTTAIIIDGGGGGGGLEQVWLGIAVLMVARAGFLAHRYWVDDDSPLNVSKQKRKKM
jgi:putative MATE family efflux protein